MPKNLFIFNFKKFPWAFLLAAAIICICEYFADRKFSGTFFSHEVDTVLHDVKTKKYDADYVLIGDSVGLQLSRQYTDDSRFVVLASNQAIEMTGQYFLIKRYLKNNALPKAVVFTSLPFIEFNTLNQAYTENFVLRTFTQLDEIYSVFTAKYDLTMLSKMITYKVLFSYTYKLQFQELIVGYTNANIYSGLDGNASSAKYDYKVSSVKIFKNFRENFMANSAEIHFRDLVSDLYDAGIDFYYIPVPIREQRKNSNKIKQHRDLFSDLFPDIQRSYSNTTFFDEYIEYPPELFVDHAHYNETGLLPARKYMDNKIKSILSLYNN